MGHKAFVTHVSDLTSWLPVAKSPLERMALPGRSPVCVCGPSWPLRR
jgi:hypothetical protein